ncbi:MAG: hypothetical protein D6798_18335 [Deltaproteobacteria bacterium]|nr:MAG: hypothetical protein D6798_18335 [Deltaproteobacteria bacterium]
MMRRSLIEPALLATSALLLGVAVHALTARPRATDQGRDFMALLDDSGDGRLDPDEFRNAAADHLDFSIIDVDDSGFVEAWELDLVIRHISSLRNSLSALPRAL